MRRPSGVVDLATGDFGAAGWDGHSQALEQREVDVDVEQFGLKAGMRSVAFTSFRRNAFRFSSPFVQAQILEPVDADIQTEAGGELSYIRATKLLQYTLST
jgi:hypothetical protein